MQHIERNKSNIIFIILFTFIFMFIFVLYGCHAREIKHSDNKFTFDDLVMTSKQFVFYTYISGDCNENEFCFIEEPKDSLYIFWKSTDFIKSNLNTEIFFTIEIQNFNYVPFYISDSIGKFRIFIDTTKYYLGTEVNIDNITIKDKKFIQINFPINYGNEIQREVINQIKCNNNVFIVYYLSMKDSIIINKAIDYKYCELRSGLMI